MRRRKPESAGSQTTGRQSGTISRSPSLRRIRSTVWFGTRLGSLIKSLAYCLAILWRRPAQPLGSELNHGCTQMNTDKTDSESVSIRVHPWLKKSPHHLNVQMPPNSIYYPKLAGQRQTRDLESYRYSRLFSTLGANGWQGDF
jgi:hypothetical protein